MTTLRTLEAIPEPRTEFYLRHSAPAHEIRNLPGLVINGVTYESHHITLYVARPGEMKNPAAPDSLYDLKIYVRMRHGGGTFFYEIDSHLVRSVIDSWLALDDAALYAMLYSFIDINDESRTTGAHLASHRLKKAFVEGRLKKRKQRGANSYEVWVEPEPVVVPDIAAE